MRTYPSMFLAKWKQPHAILTTSTVYLIIVIFIKARPLKRDDERMRKKNCEGVKNEKRETVLNK